MANHPLQKQTRGDTDGSSGSWLGNTGKQILSGAIGGIGSAAQGLHNLGASVGNYFSSPENQMPAFQVKVPTVESLRQDFNVPEPEGYAQEILDLTARTAPLLAIGGAYGLGQRLLANVASNTAMTVAKKAGAPLPVQLIAGGLTEKGLGKLQNFFKGGGKPETLNELAELTKKNLYAKEAKLGVKINSPAGKYQSKFDKIIENIENNSSLDLKDKQDLISKMNLYKNDASRGILNASKLATRDKEINALYPKLRGAQNSVARQYMGQARNIIDEAGKKISESPGILNKAWYNAWQGAKDIHKAQNYQTELADLIEESPKLAKQIAKPFLKKLLGVPYAVAGAAVEPVKFAGKAALDKGREIYGYSKFPQGQKLLKEFYGAVGQRNIPRAIQALQSIEVSVDKWGSKHADKPVGKLKRYQEDKPVGKLRPFVD